jgi:hypothetical protein
MVVNPITCWAHGWSLVVSAPHRKRQRGSSSRSMPLLVVMSRTQLKQGGYVVQFPSTFPNDSYFMVLTGFRRSKKSALGFSTHGKAHMVKPSDGGALYWESGVAQVLDRYLIYNYNSVCVCPSVRRDSSAF